MRGTGRYGDRAIPHVQRLAGALAVAVALCVIVWASGGYFPADWGLFIAGAGVLLAAAILLGVRLEVRASDLRLPVALGALAVWAGLSALWTTADGPAIHEAERGLIYASAALAVVVLLRPGGVVPLVAGIVAAATVAAGYGLATRLYPGDVGGAYDPSSGYQLAEPIGYWNALGILVVLGILLAVGLCRHRRWPVRAAGAVVLVPLATALYFTFSRGALIALAVGLVVLVVLDTDASLALVETLSLAVGPVVAVVLASGNAALTAPGATLAAAQGEGHRLGWQLAAVTAATACAGVALALVRRARATVVELTRWAAMIAAVGIVVGAVFLVIDSDGPRGVADRALAAFRSELKTEDGSLDGRLLSASSNGREDYWEVTIRMIEDEPVLGTGGGTFERRWLQDRPVAQNARDAHNLYLETLAELGPIGLALLLLGLSAPLALALARGLYRITPALAGAYCAFLAHAALDWDWEIPAVTLPAIACGASLLVLRRDEPGRRAGRPELVSIGAVACVLLVAAIVTHGGNRALANASDALDREDFARAADHAATARRWMPWSAEPWQLLGEARLGQGQNAAARTALGEAVARDPGVWSAWLALAGVPPTSEAARRQARALNPRG